MRRALTCVRPSSVLFYPRPLFYIVPISNSNITPSSRRIPHTLTTTMATTSTLPPVQGRITTKLQAALAPSHLEVINESHKHKVPPGSESHFKVVIVSEKFSDKSLLDRHRMVNDLLKEELATLIHALSIQAKTPKQWEESKVVADTPGCSRPANVPMK